MSLLSSLQSYYNALTQLAPMSNLDKPLTVMFAVGKSVDILSTH